MLLILLACTPVTLDVPVAEDTAPPEVPTVDATADTAPPEDTSPPIDATPGESVPASPALGPEDSPLFVFDAVHQFEISLSSDAQNSLSWSPFEYVPAELTYGGETIAVGLRLKGSSSYESLSGKPSMKIKVDWLVADQTFLGEKKFNLHNLIYDPSMIIEGLAYRFWREGGLPAARSGHANVAINGTNYGIYSVAEVYDDPFLEQWFTDSEGNLYEDNENYCDFDSCNCFEAEEFDEGTHDALFALCDAARANGDDWLPAVQEQMDWDRFIGFLAMERTIVHWDSYSYDLSNYRIYHDPTDDRWTFLPSSIDLSFGWRPWSYPSCGQYAMDLSDYDMGTLASRCESRPECEEAVMDKMLEFADMLDAVDAAGLARAQRDLIREYAYADNRKNYDNEHFETHGDCVIDFLEGRSEVVRAWVERQRE